MGCRTRRVAVVSDTRFTQVDWYAEESNANRDAKQASAPFFEWLENADAEMEEAD